MLGSQRRTKSGLKRIRMMGKAGCGGSHSNPSTGTLRQEHCYKSEVILGFIDAHRGQPGLQSVSKKVKQEG